MTPPRTWFPRRVGHRKVAAALLIVAAVAGAWAYRVWSDQPTRWALLATIPLGPHRSPFGFEAVCEFSPSGDLLAIFLRREPGGDRVRLLDARTGHSRPLRDRVPGMADALDAAFSPDGKFLACLYWPKVRGDQAVDDPSLRVAVWEVPSGRVAFDDVVLPGAWSSEEETLRFSPDGRRLLVSFRQPIQMDQKREGVLDGYCCLVWWEAATWRRRLAIEPYVQGHATPAFSPDGRRKVVAEARGLRVVDVASDRVLGRVTRDPAPPGAFAGETDDGGGDQEIIHFLEDGSFLWGNLDDFSSFRCESSGQSPEVVRNWRLSERWGEPSTAEQSVLQLDESRHRLSRWAIHQQGSEASKHGIKVSRQDLFNLKTGRPVCRLPFPDDPTAWACDPNGRFAAIASVRHESPRRWSDLLPAALRDRIGFVAAQPVALYHFSIVETRTCRVVGVLDGVRPSRSRSIQAQQFSPDGRTLMTQDPESGIRLWRAP